MNNILNNSQIPYNDALLSKDARNCGVYLIFEDDSLLYVGKASGQTLKRRLAEHASHDNQFNSLSKKIAKMKGISFERLDDAIDYIEKHLKVILLPFPMHSYKDGEYTFDINRKREEINILERKLIREFDPPLNKRMRFKAKH